MGETDPLEAQCRNRMGQLISGKWRLDALIGIGGMAAIYAATHRNGSMAAIKLLHPEVSSNTEIRSRFLREAYIANKVGHAGTVKVLDDDVDEETKAAYIVMELLQGETVGRRAELNGGTLSIQETLDIADQTLQVLESAHAKNIIHRDIKPDNIFITDEGKVKLLDFGIARLREGNAEKTQTGMVMGTPSYMSPEQAMGRWSEVDARTDLYAVGATLFTLLTGSPVHEAETAGEMHVAAATRQARSLGRVLSNAPFALVRLVDRALAYDRENRYPDAATFRAELAQVYEAIGVSSGSAQKVEQPQPALPPTMIAGKAAADKRLEMEKYRDTFDPSESSEQDIANLTQVFTLIERALIAEKQYSKDHPETKRRFEEAFRETASALMSCDGALAWNLTAYSFYIQDTTIWEPKEPLNRIPYQLFSDGVRTIGFVTGLDQDQFIKWLRVITIDPVTEMAPEDDLVTMLWDACFEHVFYQAIDSFAEGDQEARARFEQQRQQIVSDAHDVDLEEVTRCWHESRQDSDESVQSVDQKSNRIKNYLLSLDSIDLEAAARAANLDVRDRTEGLQTHDLLTIDDATITLLAARLEFDHGAISERFVIAASQAFITSAKMNQSSMVSVPLRNAVDSVAKESVLKAVDMVILLRDATEVKGNPEESHFLKSQLISEVVSSDTFRDLLLSAPSEEDPEFAQYIRALSEILSGVANAHFDVLLDNLADIEAPSIRKLLLEVLGKSALGNERAIGQLILKADVDLGLALVRILARLTSQEAKEAIADATQSPHPLVRIEALGHIEGASSDKLRNELRGLLDDRDPAVRLAALKAIHDHIITAAGPFLVLRMQSGRFFKLPYDEREQSFETLIKLRAKRAEDVCVNLLSKAGIFSTKSVRETHELAARLLGEIASTNQSLYLLEDISRSGKLKNCEAVRRAATQALERISQRAEEALGKGGRPIQSGAHYAQSVQSLRPDSNKTKKSVSEPRKL